MLTQCGGLTVRIEANGAEEIIWSFPGGGSRFPWLGETPVICNVMNLLEHLQDDIAEAATERWPVLAGQEALPKVDVTEAPAGLVITFGNGAGRLEVELPWNGLPPEREK